MPAVVPVAAVPIAETIVHVGDGTVVHIGDGTVRYVVKAAAVKPTRVNCAAMEPAAMEPATSVASTSVAYAVRVGEVWRAGHSNTQQRSCDASDSPFCRWPGLISV